MSQVRVIGGRLRGRRIQVPHAQGLRPTPDRLRETLFNWLAPALAGSRCIDLFAGTGVLGIEAWSRGAGEVIWIERSRRVAAHLRETLVELGGPPASQVVCGDALQWLGPGRAQAGLDPLDILFLDPPYQHPLLAPAAAALEAGDWLAEGAWIYVEQPAGTHPEVPPSWSLYRESRAGSACARLYRRCRPSN